MEAAEQSLVTEEILDFGSVERSVEDYYVTAPNSARAIEQATREGLDVVYPADNELQIDIDSAEAYETFQAHRDIVEKHVAGGIKEIVERPSKSGKPWKKHITVRLQEPVGPAERILLQACLGSDRKRDLLSYVQLIKGDPHPVLFLEKRQ